MDTDLLSTLILITEPLGRITFRSIAPDSISGGVSSVTGICKDIVCLKNQNIPTHISSVLCFQIRFYTRVRDTYSTRRSSHTRLGTKIYSYIIYCKVQNINHYARLGRIWPSLQYGAKKHFFFFLQLIDVLKYYACISVL